MKVLTDFHHGDLFESLRILVEERLGGELYRPIGLDWYHQGFWDVYPHIDTAKQYLSTEMGQEPKDIRGNPVTKEHGKNAWLNKYAEEKDTGFYVVKDHNHGGRYHKAITLEVAKTFGFDFVISSMPNHFSRYQKFCELYCKNTPHIFQMGNVGWIMPSGVKNLLNSTSYNPPANVNHVRYHQEFDLKEFCYTSEPKVVKSMCNLMHWQKLPYSEFFDRLAKVLRDRGWHVANYGAGNVDGAVDDIASVIKNFGFIWHVKLGGDGYGHNIHNSYAVGRPMIISRNETRGQIAERLFKDGTVVAIDGKSPKTIADEMEVMAKNYPEVTAKVYDAFKTEVNFSAETEAIRKFLSQARV